MRGMAAVLRARGPVVAALVTSFRATPTPWFVAVGSPRAGGMSYLAQPPRVGHPQADPHHQAS